MIYIKAYIFLFFHWLPFWWLNEALSPEWHGLLSTRCPVLPAVIQNLVMEKVGNIFQDSWCKQGLSFAVIEGRRPAEAVSVQLLLKSTVQNKTT